jgi:hypothetical protein
VTFFPLRQSRIDALNRKKEDFLSDISKFKKFAATMQDQKDAVVAAIAEMNGTIEAERTSNNPNASFFAQKRSKRFTDAATPAL